MIPVLLVACWLGARSLNERPIWVDERRSIFDAGGAGDGPLSPFGVWNRVIAENPWHAPGYFLALNAWGRFAGWQPLALRAVSLLAAMLAVAVTYRFGRDWLTARAGLYAAAILTTSAFFVHFSYEMRIYATVALLSILTVWTYLHVVDTRRPAFWGWWAGLFIGVLGILYSHYLAAITLVGVGVYHLLLGRRIIRKEPFAPSARTWWGVVGVAVAAALLFVPWLRVMLVGVGMAQEKESLHARALSAPVAATSFVWMFSNGFVVLLLALALAALWASRGDSRFARYLRRLWLITISAFVTLLAVNQVLMIMHQGRLRYFIPIWPLTALVIGAGLARYGTRPFRATILGLWVIAGFWAIFDGNLTSTLDGANITYPVQHIAYTVRDHLDRSDIVVNYLPDTLPDFDENLANYYYSVLPTRVDYLVVNSGSTPATKANQRVAAMSTITRHARVWVGYPNEAEIPSLRAFEATLGPGYHPCASLTGDGVRIDLYVRLNVSCPADSAP